VGNPICVFVAVLALLASSCSTSEPVAGGETSSSSSVATSSTDTTTAPPTTTTAVDPGPSSSTTTLTATTTAPAISDEQREAAEAVGDIDQGQELFSKANTEMPDNISCSSCHTVDGTETQWAPSLAGVYEVAGSRVDGLSDVDYLRESIVDPYAFRGDGVWPYAMPLGFADVLSQEQIDNLIAFVMTL
jgi:mono/diheme cytochrome c family protein